MFFEILNEKEQIPNWLSKGIKFLLPKKKKKKKNPGV